MSNSFISGKFNQCPLNWMFSSIRSYKKINKLRKWSLRLCDNDYTSSYDELLSKQNLVNIHIRNIQQLAIKIFKCLKGVSPLSMIDIFRVRNIHIVAKDRVLWVRNYSICMQFWQQLPAEI